MFKHRKISRVDEATGKQSITSVFDGVDAARLETFVKAPYRTLLTLGDQVLAFRQHDDIRSALRFHKEVAETVHTDFAEAFPNGG